MTTDPARDRELGSLLRSETPPEHRRGFWDELRDELEPPSSGERTLAEAFRRRLPVALVAAAALLVAVVVGVGLVNDDGDGKLDVAVDPGPDTPASVDATGLADGDRGPLRVDGAPTERGSGRVLGVSPDGRWLYVADVAGEREMACEGVPRQALFVEPVGGGERRLAAASDQLDASTVSTLHFDGAGRVASVVQCEGFQASIVTADVSDDGTFAAVERLSIPEPECHDGPVDGIVDIAYAAPGRLVAATSSVGEGTTNCRHLFSLPDTASEPTLLDDASVSMVEVAPGGRLVTATVDGRVLVDGEVVHHVADGGVSDLALSPSGAFVAVAGGAAGVDDVLVPVAGGTPVAFARDAHQVVMVDDVNGVMFASVDDRPAVAIFGADGPAAPTPVVTGDVFGFALSPDAGTLFVTVSDDMGETQRIVEVSLTR